MALFLFVLFFYLQRNIFSFSVFVFVDNVEYLRSNPTWGEEAAGWRLRKLGTNNSLNLWRRNRLNLEIMVWKISIWWLDFYFFPLLGLPEIFDLLTALVLEIGFGPPSADFGSIWSSQKARQFRHVQKTSKVRTLYFDP